MQKKFSKEFKYTFLPRREAAAKYANLGTSTEIDRTCGPAIPAQRSNH
jgi:hypothetical protein